MMIMMMMMIMALMRRQPKCRKIDPDKVLMVALNWGDVLQTLGADRSLMKVLMKV